MLIPVVGVLGAELFRRRVGGARRRCLTSNYTRGAITGLGLVNVWAALAELADLFGGESTIAIRIDPQSEIRNPQ